MSSTTNILQQAYVLATGNAASSSTLAYFETLVDQDGGGYGLVAQQVDAYMSGIAASQGVVATVKALALNGLGIVLTDEQAAEIKATLAAGGVETWAQIFEFCILLQSDVGTVLDNRANAADHFNETLASLGKSDLFSGATVNAAVKNMLQNIGASDTSYANGLAGMDVVAGKLTADGLAANAADGYLAHASVFVDLDGDLIWDPETEFHTTTNDAGSFTLPSDGEPGTVVVSGGTDLLTGNEFVGVLTGLDGAVQVSPFTSMIQAMLANGAAGTPALASDALAQALGLPLDINLLTYDPLAILASSTATPAQKDVALQVQAVAIELTNVISQLTAILDAANGPTTPAPSGAVAAALAAAIAAGAAENGGAGTFDLTSVADLKGVVQAAANAAGLPGIAAQSQAIAEIIAAGNTEAADAADITQLAKVAVVTQGVAVEELAAAGASGDFSDALDDLTGFHLDNLINHAEPGFIAPGVPVPPEPSPPLTFNAKLTSGVVTFTGTAHGDITLSWSGAPGASIATFVRQGKTASNHPDFGTTATSIALTNDTISATAPNVTNLTITGTGSVKLTDGTLDAAVLTGIDTRVSVAVDASAMTTLTGNTADILAAIASGGILTTNSYAVTVSDTISVADANTIDADTSGAVTATISDTDLATLATLTGVDNAYTITVADTTAAAASLVIVDAATTVTVDATAATTITGSAADIVAVITSTGIDTSTTYAVTVSGTISVTDANMIDADTGGIITATISNGDMASLLTLTGTGNAYTIVVTDSAVAAADLTALVATTTVAIDASGVDSIDGSALEILAVISDAGITKPADFDSTISAGAVEAADLLAILTGNGAGTIDAGLATSIDGAAADIVSVIDDVDITTAVNYGSLISAGAAAAADLLAISLDNGTGLIDAGAVTSIDGDAADIVSVIDDADITTPADYGSTITATATAAADLLAISLDNGAGTIDASAVTSIDGAAADIVSVIDDADITTPAIYNSLISAGAAAAADLLAISLDSGSGLIDAGLATSIDGSAADIVSVINDTDITTPVNYGSTISSGASAALDLLAISTDNGTGTVDATAATSIDGTAGNIVNVINDTTITKPADFDSTITNNASSAANLLAVSAANGTGTIDAGGVTSINGSAANVVDVINDTTITKPADFDSTIQGASASAGNLLTISANNGTGTVNASGVTSINGSALNVAGVVADGTITKPADFDTNITGNMAAAADLLAISGGNGLGTITATGLNAINGLAADIVSVIGDAGILKPANFHSTVTGAAAASDLLAIAAGNGTGTVNATAVTSIDGSAAGIVSVINESTITKPANFDSTVSTGASAATDLLAISTANGSGTINAGAATSIDGSSAKIVDVINDAAIAKPVDFDSTLTAGGASSAGNLLTIAGNNGTGTVDASGLTAINGGAANIVSVINEGTITKPTNFNSNITGTTAVAADLLAISLGNGTGTITAGGLAAINGLAVDIVSVINDGAITTPTNFNSTISASAAAAADLLAISAGNGTGTLNAAAVTSIDGAASDIVLVINDTTITTPTDYSSTITATATAAADLLTISLDNGGGTINAGAATSIDGSAADIVSVIDDADITTPAIYNSLISAGAAAAADLLAISLDSGTGLIDASAATSIDGSAADIVSVIDDTDITTPGTYNSLISAGAVSAADLLTISADNGNGAINAGAATSIDGDAADIVGVINDANITTPADFSSTITATATAAADLLAISLGNGAGTIDAGAATSIDGAAADIVSVINDADITTPAAYGSTISATATAATDLLAISLDNGGGAIDASAATSIDGSAANIVLVINDADITTPAIYNSLISAGATAAADLLTISLDSGSGLINAGAATSIDGSATDIVSVINDADITTPAIYNSLISAGATAAADLLAISLDNGSGTIDAGAATSIDGSAANIVLVINDAGITTPVNYNSTIAAGAAAALDLLAISTDNGTGTVNAAAASSIDGTAGNVVDVINDASITKPLDFNTTLSGNSPTAVNLLAISAANGTGTLNASGVLAINGTSVNVVSVINDASITKPANFNTTITNGGASTASDLLAIAGGNGSGTVDASGLASINGGAANIVSVINDASITKPANFGSTIATGAAVAADLLAIAAGNGTGTVIATAVTSIDGNAGNIVSVISDGTITKPASFNSTISAGVVSSANLLAILAGNGTGTIDAGAVTSINGTAANIVSVINDADLATPINYNSTITAGAVAAADLLAIAADNGSGTVNAGSVTSINGLASAIVSVINEVTITKPANFASTIAAGGASASNLLVISLGNGTGVIDASAATSINGAAVDIVGVINDSTITKPANFNSTVSGAAAAADLIAIAGGNGTGTVTATAVTSIDGSLADIITVIGDGTITKPTNFDSTLPSGSANAAQLLNVSSANGTGTVIASAVTAINGSSTNIAAVIGDTGITKPGNFGTNVTGTSATAAELITISAGNGTGTVTFAGTVTAINGTAAQIVTVINDSGITTPTNYGSTITAGAVAATDLLAISTDNGTGIVTATSATSINGTAANIASVIGDANILKPTNFGSTVSGAAAALDLISIAGGNGTGTVTATAVTSIDGSVSDIQTVLGDGTITKPGNFNSTIATGNANAGGLLAISTANGSGTINAGAATAINGSAVNIVSVINDADIATPTNFSSNITGTAASASDVIAILTGNGSGTITFGGSVTSIDGTAADIVTVIGDSDVTTPATYSSLLSSGVVAATDLIAISADNGSGVINASAVTHIDGTAANILSVINDPDITTPTNYDSTIPASTAAASALVAILADNGSGTIDAGLVTHLDGTAADILAVINSSDVTSSASETVTVSSGTATVLQANGIDADTSGLVTATISEGDLATLVTLTDHDNAYTITVTDATAAAANLNTVDALTSVTVGATAVTLLTGSYQEVVDAEASSGISLSGTQSVAITDTVANLDGKSLVANGAADSLVVSDIASGGAGLDLQQLTGFNSITLAGVGDVLLDTILIGEGAGAVITASAAVNVKMHGTGGQLFIGSLDDDIVTSFSGGDALNGGAGNDTITAGEGSDTIRGGDGDDVIDISDSGAVADFVYLDSTLGQDHITGFTLGEDHLFFGVGGLGLNAADYAPGAVTVINAATAAGLASGGSWDNYVVVDSEAAILALAIVAGSATGPVLAISSDTGNVYLDADGTFVDATVIATVATAGAFTAADLGLIA